MRDSDKKLAVATFAGGCFWCMEHPYDELEGVHKTISGYTGGNTENPTYEEVCSGRTGHAEAVQVYYDPEKISYAELLEVFWRNIDPTQKDAQFCDLGTQYRTAIYYADETEKELALASLKKLKDSGRFKNIHTQIEPVSAFYAAEDYHQGYYQKNPIRYKSYRLGSGRDRRLKELWGERK